MAKDFYQMMKNKAQKCEISGSHSVKYEDDSLLGYTEV
jgi:hypothetical protein